MHNFEQLGSLYLGRAYGLTQGRVLDDLILYDANDLTTHGLCIGMTGSGKTGLCIDLLEEAAIDGVPAIVVDPKGDLGNLLLTFPELRAEDFRPWIDEEQAARKGLTPEAYAAEVAETWRKGLADWGQDGARIARLRQAAEAVVYTPGSTAGLPLSVLRSFDAPPPQVAQDTEALRDRIQGAVSGLLALLGVEADPVASREHILLSTILERAWAEGRHLDLPTLIGEVQQPPFSRIGVMDLDAVYPQKDRFELAIRLNQLLASPSFAGWMEGEPLDVGRLLYTAEGRPRIAVLSIAHLSDPERMFFVTLLLNEAIAWMRRQPGTPSLRALLYMDEVFGFFPPTSMPPSKRPMLTLLKQARAFGLGVVLATQNPVDLDYKALANMGTWFIGRLQTERDKARVLDGLEGAAAATGQAFDRARLESVVAALGSRVFLMHNVHESEPVVFHSRWALSYLRGPLTREQIRRLMADRRPTDAPSPTQPAPAPAAPAPAAPEPLPERPLVGSEVSQYFLPLARAPQAAARLRYRPAIVGAAQLHYVRAGAGLDQWRDVMLLADLPDETGRVPWESATVLPGGSGALESAPLATPADYEPAPADLGSGKQSAAWQRDLIQFFYAEHALRLWQCAALKQTSGLGETEAEFRARLAQLARERRDLAVSRLRSKYQAKLATIQDRVGRAEERLNRARAEQGYRGVETTLSVGATLVGALFGRKIASRRNVTQAASAVRRVARTARGGGEVATAETALNAAQEQLAATEQELAVELQSVEAAADPMQFELTELVIPPRKSDIALRALGLAWVPWELQADGSVQPLFRT